MPWACLEYKTLWIRLASALPSEGCPCWRSQYCMTMAMLAAPQASFSCLTKGTSSQMPGASAAHNKLQRHSDAVSVLLTCNDMGPTLSHSDNDQNQRCDGQDDNDQIPVAQRARGKVGLGFIGS